MIYSSLVPGLSPADGTARKAEIEKVHVIKERHLNHGTFLIIGLCEVNTPFHRGPLVLGGLFLGLEHCALLERVISPLLTEKRESAILNLCLF